jgi:hypothetical protein
MAFPTTSVRDNFPLSYLQLQVYKYKATFRVWG